MNPLMANSFALNRLPMQRYLSQFAGQHVLYHPNPGNGGDSMIALGTFHAFDRAGIHYQPINLDTDVTGRIVFLAGGGNLVPLYGDIAAAFREFQGKAARIILLPHTIRGHDELLAELDARCTIFCRDAESYAHVTRLNNTAEVYLDHDMACHLDAPELLAEAENRAFYNAIVRQTLKKKGLDLANSPLVSFFRADWESARHEQTTDMDISAEYRFGVWPDDAEKGAWCMLKTVSMATFIQTDRLHVALACALVGTPCLLYDNSYGKNASVYRHSLRNRAPFIKFREFEMAERGLHHEAF